MSSPIPHAGIAGATPAGFAGTTPRKCESLTEREGFEPSVPLRVHRFSKPTQSTTLAPLRSGAADGIAAGRCCQELPVLTADVLDVCNRIAPHAGAWWHGCADALRCKGPSCSDSVHAEMATELNE